MLNQSRSVASIGNTSVGCALNSFDSSMLTKVDGTEFESVSVLGKKEYLKVSLLALISM